MRHTFVFLIAIYLSINRVSAQTCYPNGITLASQDNVDAFVLNNPTCEEIEGFLIIQGSTVTDISGLLNLRKVNGNLFIRDCPQLLSLDGLQNLDSVGRDFSLTNLTNLESMDSLYRLRHVQESFQVYECNSLLNLDGLQNLSYAGSLTIENNDTLQNINALSSLTNIQDNIYIDENPALLSLQGIENIGSINGFLRITQNQQLQNLCNWNNLISIGSFVTIIGNSSLTNLEGLNNLTSIGGNLRIENHESLQNLNGLNSLSFIDGNLSITNSDALTDLSALSNLTAINGRLKVETNAVLSSLVGLDQIDHTTINEISVGWSPNLSMCAVASVCSYLNAATGPAYIGENALGCDTEFQVRTICEFLGESKIESNGLSIYPNPAQDFINLKFNEALKQNTKLTVLDISGRVVFTTQVPLYTEQFQLSTVEWKSGLYHIVLQNDTGLKAMNLSIVK